MMARRKIAFTYTALLLWVILVFIAIHHYAHLCISVQNKTYIPRPTMPFAKDIIGETGKESSTFIYMASIWGLFYDVNDWKNIVH